MAEKRSGPKKKVRVRVPRRAYLVRFFLHPAGQILAVCLTLAFVAGAGVLTHYYTKYSRLIDQKLRAGPFANTSKIYAAPRLVAVGDSLTAAEIAEELRRAGYTESHSNAVGCYQLRGDSAIEIYPGPESFAEEAGVIKFAKGQISQIVSLRDNTARPEYRLEPELITNLFDRNREKRRLVKFGDIPKVLINAVTSAEDKRFFQHAGFDPIGMVRAAFVDIKQGRKDQGASTLSMQLAREFFLDKEKRWTRKLAEMLITVRLEQRLTKEQIFEDYCNQIYLGSRGTFRIHGFGEAAEAFLGKDLSQVNLPEAAELASLPRWPAYFDPFRHPEHLIERRNAVLALMQQNGYVTDRDYALAREAPLTVAKGTAQSAEAPYFVDMVDDFLSNKLQDADLRSSSFRVYTTLDLNLQRAAAEAVSNGIKSVNELVRKQKRFKGQSIPEVQCALIALDPHTGEVKALAGGYNYGVSQLNHVLAKRQPGSIFKPFVYAAALNTTIQGGPRILTASTTVVDEPTTFWYDNKPYEPSNFKHEFHGTVTLRQALAKSMNVATVKVGEMVGFEAIVDLAKEDLCTPAASRICPDSRDDLQPTPAVALGSYEVTPWEMAGAYTMFANGGVRVEPAVVSSVRSQDGQEIYQNQIEKRAVLDPRVAYLMTNLMEEVMRSGTAAGVRGLGFTVPAAGKTGTSHDGWFAGYTSNLLCIVWVGFDDNRQLDLEGAHSALPIWTEFMKRAIQQREYRDTQPFEAPDGIVSAQIDPESGMLATPYCPETISEVYISGTQPVTACPLHSRGQQSVTNVAGWEVASPAPAVEAAPHVNAPPTTLAVRRPPPPPPPVQPAPAAEKPKEKKSLFRRFLSVFK